MANKVDIDNHKKILGVLYVVFSSLNIVGVLFFVLVASSIIPIHVDDQEALLVVNIVKYALISLTLFLTLPALITGPWHSSLELLVSWDSRSGPLLVFIRL